MKTARIQGSQVLRIVVMAALFLAVSPAVNADVTDAAANGFTIKATVNIHASPADVYKRLVGDIGKWWNSGHTFSGDARNLSIEERPMGCFCEKLPNQGAVRHMEVIFLRPGKTLRMSGAIGPLQSLAVSAIATFNLTAEEDGTKLELTYIVGGYSPQGLKGIAPLADSVLTEQITRLKNYVETGNPDGKETKQ